MNKIKYMLVLFALPLFVLPVYAQTGLGIMGGLNFARLSGGDANDAWSTRTGLGFGGVLQVDLSRAVAVQVQPMYLQQGTNDVDEPPRYTGHLALAYLNLPFLFKINLAERPRIKPYVLVGPNLAFTLSAKFIDDNGELDDLKNATHRSDFGLNVGAGIDLPVGKNAVFFEVQYGLGLTNIIANARAYDDESAKNRSFKIMGGIFFPLATR